MPTWKGDACVATVSTLPLLILFNYRPNLLWTSLAALGYAWLLSNYTWKWFSSPLRRLPWPSSTSFILGNVLTNFSRPPGREFFEWTQQFPESGIVACSGFLHHGITLLATSPEAVKEVLNDKSEDYVKPPPVSNFFRGIMGDGLVVSERAKHKLHRRLLTPAFQGSYIKDLLPIFWSKSLQMTEVIHGRLSKDVEAAGRGQAEVVVEINELVSRATLDIIGLGSVGRDFNTLENNEDQLAKNFSALLDPTNKSLFYYFVTRLLLSPKIASILFRKGYRFYLTTSAALRSCAVDLVSERKKLIEQKAAIQPDIISILMRSTSPLSDQDLTDQLLTFLAAGNETTSSASTWVYYLLATHRKVQDRLRTELRDHFHDGTDLKSLDSQALASLMALPYLHAVCNETMRVFPPIPFTGRMTARPTTILGVPVPAGTGVNVCAWAMNRLPSIWGEDAEEFNPDRWMAEGCANTGGVGTFGYITFGHGPRGCIGQGFARAEMKCLVAALVMRFDFELADKNYVPMPDGIATIKPRDGLPLRLRKL